MRGGWDGNRGMDSKMVFFFPSCAFRSAQPNKSMKRRGRAKKSNNAPEMGRKDCKAEVCKGWLTSALEGREQRGGGRWTRRMDGIFIYIFFNLCLVILRCLRWSSRVLPSINPPALEGCPCPAGGNPWAPSSFIFVPSPWNTKAGLWMEKCRKFLQTIKWFNLLSIIEVHYSRVRMHGSTGWMSFCCHPVAMDHVTLLEPDLFLRHFCFGESRGGCPHVAW